MTDRSDHLGDPFETSNYRELPLPIRGDTQLFVIIGDPIAQVGSPAIFNTIFRQAGAAAVLVPYHVGAEDLEDALRGFRGARNLGGIIVTVPHKIAVLPLIDDVGDSARRIGAVNAIRREPDGALIGDNFDGQGCVAGLYNKGHQVAGRRVLLIGAGGAGRAVANALADAGAGAITLYDLDPERAAALAQSICENRPSVEVRVGSPDPSGYDVVVNCSPLGMKPEDPYPVDPARLSPQTLVVDAVLKPRISPLLKAAGARGCMVQPGYRMLEGQAHAIAEFFGIKTG